MSYARILPSPDRSEAENVDAALAELRRLGALSGDGALDHGRFESFRRAVKSCFEVTWTSIRPPMERLLYGINAVQRPKNLFALGIFCGNTLIWNAGAACGPGKVYDADRIVGVEIDPKPAALARQNLERLGVSTSIDLRCEDAHESLRQLPGPIDFLYLDANDYRSTGPSRGKRIYLTLLELAYPKLSPGAVIIAHDHLIANFHEGGEAYDYLQLVRTSGRFRTSVSVEIDDMGIEVTSMP